MITAEEAVQIARVRTMRQFECLLNIISSAIEDTAKMGGYSMTFTIDYEVVIYINDQKFIHSTMKEDFPNLLRELVICGYKFKEISYYDYKTNNLNILDASDVKRLVEARGWGFLDLEDRAVNVTIEW